MIIYHHTSSSLLCLLFCLQLKGYPTWEIRGQQFPGEKSLEELERVLDDVEASASIE